MNYYKKYLKYKQKYLNLKGSNRLPNDRIILNSSIETCIKLLNNQNSYALKQKKLPTSVVEGGIMVSESC